MKQLFTTIFLLAITSIAFSQNWTWLTGTNGSSGAANYGTKGVEAASNTPGARTNAAHFKDASGNFWIFGGVNGTSNYNDLWRFNVTNNRWTWMSGSSSTNSIGSTTGTIEPSARQGCGYTVDNAGNFYIYAGLGRSSTYPDDDIYLYDIFKYTVATGLWSNISEGNLGNTPGTGVGNSSGFYFPSIWVTSTDLYAFGGAVSTSSSGYYNNMHKFNFTSNTWSLVTSGATAMGAFNGEGTVGYPSARWLHTYWTDNSGNFWFFGGYGKGVNMGVANVAMNLNDLWKFNPTTNVFTQVKGGNNSNSGGNYGTLGVAAATNRVPNRTTAFAAVASNNKFILCGGVVSGPVYYNDVWEFNTTTNNWRWVAGSSSANNTGVYGTQGVGSSTNIYGGTESMNGCISNNKLYLFGGKGIVSGGGIGTKNITWSFDLTTILPTTLSNFVGKLNNQTASLNWQTKAEVNSSHFELQYSLDGTSFSTIQAIAALGNSNTTQNYTAQHKITNGSNHYYRLKMIDKDGSFTYSKIVHLQFNDKGFKASVYPTVNFGNATIQVNTTQTTQASIIISNAKGQVVQTKNVQLQQGSQTLPVNISNAASGTYYIKISNASTTLNLVMIKH